MRTIKALIVPHDTPAYLTTVEATGDALGKIVGGWLEAIGVNGEAVCYMNEEGKLQNLPRNENANRLNAVSAYRLMPGDFIVGNVVITGSLNANGESDGHEHDVPASVLTLCEQAGIDVEDRTAA